MQRNGRRAATTISIIALTLAAAAGARAAGSSLLAESGLETSTVPAPADYVRHDGASTAITFGVAKALGPGPAGDPIFVIETLGESGTEAANEGLIDSLKDLRGKHDLVFVDQRGSSGAQRLVCPPPPGLSPGAAETLGLFAAARIGPCRAALATRVDLEALNSQTFAKDVETVRRSLGAKRIELIGYFYGARIVLEYIRRWPQRVAAAVITDLPSADFPSSEAAPLAALRATSDALAACRADPGCRARYPDLDAEWLRLAVRLRRSKIAAHVVGDGKTRTVQLEGVGLLRWLESRPLRWQDAVGWPHDVHALASGVGDAVTTNYLAYRRAVLAAYPLALRLSVDCAEELGTVRAVPPEFLDGPDGLAAEQAACRHWPHRNIRDALRQPVPATTPVLALTGEFDVEAPPQAVRRTLAGLKRSEFVVFPGRARATDYDWDACVGPMTTAFLASHGRAKIDHSCVGRLKRPAFSDSASNS